MSANPSPKSPEATASSLSPGRRALLTPPHRMDMASPEVMTTLSFVPSSVWTSFWFFAYRS